MTTSISRVLRQTLVVMVWAILFPPTFGAAEGLMQDNFDSQPMLRWNYFSDQVMGGVSVGRVAFLSEQGESFMHMTGEVSTENNGGFIQLRRSVAKGSVEQAAGVYAKVRGNGQQYYLHVRTSGTLLPWQYYQASFSTTDQWQLIKVPLSAFVRSGGWLSTVVKPGSIRSIGIVAYGRDHSADIQVAEIGFY